jgi:hypothetical protein
MKKVALLGLIGLMAIAGSSFAQDVEPRKDLKEFEKMTVEESTEKMKAELELTEVQAIEIKSLNEEHMKEMDEIRAEMKKLKERAKAKKDAHHEKVNAVLTAEQREKHEAKMAEHKKRHEMRKHQCHHNPEEE